MRPRSRRTSTAAVLVAALTTGVTGPPAEASEPAAAGGAGESSSQVTLITGDQVAVTTTAGRTALRVTPARRGRPVPFQEYTRHGDRYVLPADAALLVRAGTLDGELFNVTGLLRQGYDDAHTQDIPLLVRQSGAAAAARSGAAVRRALPGLGITALDARKSGASAFWAGLASGAKPAAFTAGVQKVWLNAKVHASLDQSVPQIGAPAAWRAGLTGSGVRVAVLDTGIATTHPDLRERIALSQDFTGKGNAEDGNGHGTHVASTIAGSGAASGGKYKGVAPDAALAVGKVLDDAGDGTLDTVIAGMQWAAGEAHAKIVNMSLGAGPSDGTDPVSEAVNTLTRQYGTLFVAAAGNSGADESVSTPAAADLALAVASVSKQDVLSPFSSRGPRIGDGAAKPDIAAPGGAITAARPAGVPPIGKPVGDAYQTLDGTSMATPHVTGSAAILAQEHPDWAPDRLKAALMSSAHEVTGTGPAAVGTGRVDVGHATTTTVTATGSVSAFLPWPNHGVQKRSAVTWYNSGANPVTLSLQANLTGSDGKPAPAGLLTLSSENVEIPAGGSTPIEVVTTTQDGQPGTYSGMLTARTADGTGITRTALSIRQENEMYDLTVGLVDRDGKPAAPVDYASLAIIDLDTGALTNGAPGTYRLPRGRYAVNSIIETARPGQEPSYSFITHPELTLDHSTTQVLDARVAKPVSAEPDNPAARGGSQVIERLSKISACSCTFADTMDLDPRFHQAFAATVPGTASSTFAFGQERRATEPDLELTANDGQPFEVRGRWLESAAPAEHATVPVVHGGAGLPEDLKKIDARGKLVVLEIAAGIQLDEIYRRVAAVKDAGGKLAMVDVVQDVAGPAKLGGSLPPLALPTIWSSRSVTANRFAAFAKAGGTSANFASRPSPNFRYELAYGVERQVTTPQVQRPRTRDLAEVRTAYHDNAPGEVRYGAGMEFFGQELGFGYTEPAAAQQERAEYFTPGTWRTFWSTAWRGDLDDTLVLAAGRHYRIAWNKAVAGPSLRGLTVTHSGEVPRPWAWRKDGVFDMWLPMYGDAAGRPRVPDDSSGDTGSISLYKDGVSVPVERQQLLAATMPVPDADAAYRLVADVHRTADSWPLWTSVSAEWTFRSSAEKDGKALPLLTTRFDPAVDVRNRAPGGRSFSFPAYVERQDGGARISAFTVDVSYDDGRTWQAAAVRAEGDHWTVCVQHPAAGYASLRASATDADANTVRQSVVRAYQIGG